MQDWFNDVQAPQWSYYLSRLRSASRLAPGGGVSYGGYVVPRDSGQSADGLLLKVVSVIGSGAKVSLILCDSLPFCLSLSVTLAV